MLPTGFLQVSLPRSDLAQPRYVLGCGLISSDFISYHVSSDRRIFYVHISIYHLTVLYTEYKSQ